MSTTKFPNMFVCLTKTTHCKKVFFPTKLEKIVHNGPNKDIGLNFNNQINLGECRLDGIESLGLNDIKPFQPQDLFHVHF